MPLVPAHPTDQQLGDLSIWQAKVLAGAPDGPPALRATPVADGRAHFFSQCERKSQALTSTVQRALMAEHSCPPWWGLPLPGPGSEGSETGIHSKLGRLGEKRRKGPTHQPQASATPLQTSKPEAG